MATDSAQILDSTKSNFSAARPDSSVNFVSLRHDFQFFTDCQSRFLKNTFQHVLINSQAFHGDDWVDGQLPGSMNQRWPTSVNAFDFQQLSLKFAWFGRQINLTAAVANRDHAWMFAQD